MGYSAADSGYKGCGFISTESSGSFSTFATSSPLTYTCWRSFTWDKDTKQLTIGTPTWYDYGVQLSIFS